MASMGAGRILAKPRSSGSDSCINACRRLTQFTETFGANADPSQFMSDVTKVALNFVWLALGAMAGSYIQVRKAQQNAAHCA